MSVENFFQDAEWDAPFFKLLAANDTGAASGHQGGIVIPKPLRQYFPELNPKEASSTAPTVDSRLWVELWSGTNYLETVNSRYQFQTWGGTRTPESRLTDNLGKLRNIAKGGDLLIMQRHAIEITRYRLVLIKQEDSASFIGA
jgi:putative restriction endonuclease